MSITAEEIAIIDAKMDTLTTADLPPNPIVIPAMDLITTPVVTYICNQMKNPKGIHTAIGLVRKAKEDYSRRFSLEQMQYVIDAWKKKTAEIYQETHPTPSLMAVEPKNVK